MESKFIELIFEGKYTKAEEIIMKISSSEQREMIMNLAYESETIAKRIIEIEPNNSIALDVLAD